MDVDPDTLLEWLGMPGDMQLVALEQLCMLLLLSDNVDRVFERCPPRTFIPALCTVCCAVRLLSLVAVAVTVAIATIASLSGSLLAAAETVAPAPIQKAAGYWLLWLLLLRGFLLTRWC